MLTKYKFLQNPVSIHVLPLSQSWLLQNKNQALLKIHDLSVICHKILQEKICLMIENSTSVSNLQKTV